MGGAGQRRRFCCALARQVTFSTFVDEQQVDHLQEALRQLPPLTCLGADRNYPG